MIGKNKEPYEPREWVSLVLGASVIMIQIHQYHEGELKGDKVEMVIFALASFLMLSPRSLVTVLLRLGDIFSTIFKDKNDNKK